MNALLALVIATAPVDPRFVNRFTDMTNNPPVAVVSQEEYMVSVSNRHERIKRERNARREKIREKARKHREEKMKAVKKEESK